MCWRYRDVLAGDDSSKVVKGKCHPKWRTIQGTHRTKTDVQGHISRGQIVLESCIYFIAIPSRFLPLLVLFPACNLVLQNLGYLIKHISLINFTLKKRFFCTLNSTEILYEQKYLTNGTRFSKEHHTRYPPVSFYGQSLYLPYRKEIDWKRGEGGVSLPVLSSCAQQAVCCSKWWFRTATSHMQDDQPSGTEICLSTTVTTILRIKSLYRRKKQQRPRR